MKVSGFTIVRNAVKFDYPEIESITSVLPLVDEMIVAVGNSSDTTLDLMLAISSPKIKIIQSTWNDSLRQGGHLLAQETNKALQHIAADTDWCFYIQADEVIHQNHHHAIRQSMLQHLHNSKVDGLLFNYLHFYGSYKYIADAYNWYRKEIRIIRKTDNIFSYKDAQGFRKRPNQKLRVKQVDATVFHYGWVKHPLAQQQKQLSFHRLWHPDDWLQKNIPQTESFNYSAVDSLRVFNGTHPQVMQARIQNQNWLFSFDTSKKNLKLSYRLRQCFENLTGYNLGEYKNYKLL